MTQRDSLLRVIIKDLWTYKQVSLLAILVVGSAFAVIVVTHETRLLTAQREALLSEKDSLGIEWRNLLLEQYSLEEHSRIRVIARDKFQMRRPNSAKEQVVEVP